MARKYGFSYGAERRVSRKNRTCAVCGCTIRKSGVYFRVTCFEEGSATTYDLDTCYHEFILEANTWDGDSENLMEYLQQKKEYLSEQERKELAAEARYEQMKEDRLIERHERGE